MNLIGNSNDTLEPPLGEYHKTIKTARAINDADREYRSAIERGATREAHHHGKLLLTKYPRFGLVLYKAPQGPKLTVHTIWLGPALILARQTLGQNLFIMNLDSGIIMKKSYRSVRPYLKPSYYNLPLEMRDSLQAAYPLCLNHGTQDPNLAHTSQPPTDIFDPKEHAHTEALRNILTVFSYI